jgi:hypothetical protein
LQVAQLSGIDARHHRRKRHAVDARQVLHIFQRHRLIDGHGRQRRYIQIAGVDHQQWRLPRSTDAQQGFTVAEHVLEQRRLVLDQLQGVAVVEERTQLIDPADQRNVIAANQLLFQLLVQRRAEAGQRSEGEQREHQRQAQGQRIGARNLHGRLMVECRSGNRFRARYGSA